MTRPQGRRAWLREGRRTLDAERERQARPIPHERTDRPCFGTSEWPTERPVPQASIEFEVADAAAVAAAGEELRAAGYELLHPAREEPWGQTVARMLSTEGLIVGISHAPALHR